MSKTDKTIQPKYYTAEGVELKPDTYIFTNRNEALEVAKHRFSYIFSVYNNRIEIKGENRFQAPKIWRQVGELPSTIPLIFSGYAVAR